MYQISRGNDSLMKRKLKGCNTWSYIDVETKEQANEIKKKMETRGLLCES